MITKFDDTAIDSGPTLIGEIWTHKPGDKVTLTYKRDGKDGTRPKSPWASARATADRLGCSTHRA